MKKLMIAAVVAAVAGGAFATQYVYDFSATLKTTKARMGKATVEVQFGADVTGTNFWYSDSSITNYTKNAPYAKAHKVGGQWVPSIDEEIVKNDDAVQEALLALWKTGKYANKSAGQWCATFKWTEEDCYRVPGSTKLTERFYQNDCCDDLIVPYAFYNMVNGSLIQYANTSTNGVSEALFQYFGSLAFDKVNKVEIFAPITLRAPDVAPLTFIDLFGGYLAGQGTLATRNGNVYVSAISGNIVGTLPAPKCEHCCTLPTNSYAFDCLYEDYLIDNNDATIPDAYLPYTAGFGTFRLKINNSLSTF